MIQDGITILLKANAGVSALTTSIIPVGVSQGTVSPCIVYHIGTELDTVDVKGSTGYRCARFQFDCYSAKSYTEAKAVARAVRLALQNLQNTPLTDADTTFVQGCMVDMESDMPFVPEGLDSIEYRVMVQVSVWFLES
jgi:hypothetical protein